MEKQYKTIEVSFWSESAKCLWLLTRKGATPGSWSNKVRFYKSQCEYDHEKGLLTMPLWVFKKYYETSI